MPRRATKRGAERTRLDADADVLVCGASFAGLAVARELADTGARVLVVDRYDIGEKQTSACGIPTAWLEGLDLPEQQRFAGLVVHTPHPPVRLPLPWTFSTFDYRTICERLWEQNDGTAEFETAKVNGRTGDVVHTDRGDLRAPLIVDALGWRRVLGSGNNVQPPEAFLSRGLEVHPEGNGSDLEIWVDRSYVRAGYGWSFPAGEEVRVGVGSFDPRDRVKEPTNRLAGDLDRPKVNYQGNWIPHRIRPAAEDGLFLAGDSAGHCIPLTAEGIRTALYFGMAAGREIGEVVAGRRKREDALARYGAFSSAHAWKFGAMRKWQDLIPKVPPRALARTLRGLETPAVSRWAFDHYLELAHPRFVGAQPRPGRRLTAMPAAAAA